MIVAAKLLAFPVDTSDTQGARRGLVASDTPARRCRGCDGRCESEGGCAARKASAAKIAAKANQGILVRLTMAN